MMRYLSLVGVVYLCLSCMMYDTYCLGFIAIKAPVKLYLHKHLYAIRILFQQVSVCQENSVSALTVRMKSERNHRHVQLLHLYLL